MFTPATSGASRAAGSGRMMSGVVNPNPPSRSATGLESTALVGVGSANEFGDYRSSATADGSGVAGINVTNMDHA